VYGAVSATGVHRRATQSRRAFDHARSVLTRGVASSARLRQHSDAVVLRDGDGASVFDLDDNRYVDYALALGPVILGHRPPTVLQAVRSALDHGIAYGAPHKAEAELCEAVVRAVPCAEKVALSTTGSEAVALALRIARAGTGRRRIVKFDGHYHGWLDPVFVNTPTLLPLERSPAHAVHSVHGLPADDSITVVRWGELPELERALTDGPPVAAVIMEPLPCNFGVVQPPPGYLEAVRDLCRRNGSLLVFDEVLTGFRVALGGAQELLGVQPDLTVCSKALASGFPLALVAGTDGAMAPAIDGPVQPFGTFSGFPASVAAALATLRELERRRDEIYPRLERLGANLAAGICAAALEASAPLTVNQIGSVLQLFWGAPDPVTSYADACRSDRERIAALAGRLLDHGVHTPERGLMLVCDAHTSADVDAAAEAFTAILAEPAAGTDHTPETKGAEA
jgi:glutamate-1-semialdehyde 2,1-aminomutase